MESITAYISSDGQQVTDWRDKVLGRVIHRARVNLPRWSYVHGYYYFSYRVAIFDDSERGYSIYHGRSSPGVLINLRPYIQQSA